ncbi:AMIN-like domain-containing (lipo)protein [Nocardia aurea]|uniref:AMIN-like domain-containing protein n=1 Tax=Nocardia aurea TaxID=2144174 RepID=A0ABV3FUX9_9NOCA
MRNTIVSTIAVTAALLTGCDDGDTTRPPSNVSSTAGTTGTFADVPAPAPADAQPKRGEPSSGAGLTVTGIRIGSQPGFDRVVYDLGGTGSPGWIVQYTDRAVQDGSGNQIDVAGRSILEVQITGSAYPFDSGVTPYEGPDPATAPGTPGIAGVYRTVVFEGTTQSFIGVNAASPGFSVSTLANPTRLVIDIATR